MPTTTHERIDFRGLAASRVSVGGATLIVTDFGAHVCAWSTPDGVERLFLSETAVFDAKTPIRGGVPVIFPQFGPTGPLPRHGFARTATWQLGEVQLNDEYATLTWRLTQRDATASQWAYAFSAELTALLSAARLDIELEVENTDAGAFDFGAALHTYLRVHEVEHARLFGLQDLEYIDQADRNARKTEKHEAVFIERETDRIYLGAPPTLLLREPRRTLAIETLGFPNIVVWNPWESATAQIKDMTRSGFRHMLCVEAAAAHKRIHLAPGEAWVGRQSLIAQ